MSENLDAKQTAAYDVKLCRLISKKELKPGIFDFWVEVPDLPETRPGQFGHIRLPGHSLRRPISICERDGKAGRLRFVFQIRGGGTEELARFCEGDELDILLPLGNGFPLFEKTKKVLLVGGGIGVPPLLELAKHYTSASTAALGFRNAAAAVLQEDFKAAGARLITATDDGSEGFHGTAVQAAEKEDFVLVYACGPLPMLKAAAQLAAERAVPCYVSLEERMACGVGACLGCAVKLRRGESEYFGHVCKDGPVFDSRKLVF